MIRRGGDAIVSVAGMSSYRGNSSRSRIMAAKNALMGHTCGLALNLALKIFAQILQLWVGLIPCEAQTPLLTGLLKSQMSNLGREATPQDMANLIRFLVGPRSTYWSGKTIHLNDAALCPH